MASEPSSGARASSASRPEGPAVPEARPAAMVAAQRSDAGSWHVVSFDGCGPEDGPARRFLVFRDPVPCGRAIAGDAGAAITLLKWGNPQTPVLDWSVGAASGSGTWCTAPAPCPDDRSHLTLHPLRARLTDGRAEAIEWHLLLAGGDVERGRGSVRYCEGRDQPCG